DDTGRTSRPLTVSDTLSVTSFSRSDYFFFFSSRRRHTRSKRDWSSDVCSSDLPLQSSKVLKEALDLAKANNTFLAVHEEDPELNGILGFNEHIAQDKFHFCGATGVAEYSMIARDVMIAYDRGVHLHIQHLSKAESVKVVEFAQQLGAHITAAA